MNGPWGAWQPISRKACEKLGEVLPPPDETSQKMTWAEAVRDFVRHIDPAKRHDALCKVILSFCPHCGAEHDFASGTDLIMHCPHCKSGFALEDFTA